jgi:hypothetical protein
MLDSVLACRRVGTRLALECKQRGLHGTTHVHIPMRCVHDCGGHISNEDHEFYELFEAHVPGTFYCYEV